LNKQPAPLIFSSETTNGISRSYQYTDNLQLGQLTITIDGTSHTVKHQYDSVLGRPKAMEYP
jgi:hypothetical protein